MRSTKKRQPRRRDASGMSRSCRWSVNRPLLRGRVDDSIEDLPDPFRYRNRGFNRPGTFQPVIGQPGAGLPARCAARTPRLYIDEVALPGSRQCRAASAPAGSKESADAPVESQQFRELLALRRQNAGGKKPAAVSTGWVTARGVCDCCPQSIQAAHLRCASVWTTGNPSR